MENIIIALIIIITVGASLLYICKKKKSGAKCIGCPYSDTCCKCSSKHIADTKNKNWTSLYYGITIPLNCKFSWGVKFSHYSLRSYFLHNKKHHKRNQRHCHNDCFSLFWRGFIHKMKCKKWNNRRCNNVNCKEYPKSIIHNLLHFLLYELLQY